MFNIKEIFDKRQERSIHKGLDRSYKLAEERNYKLNVNIRQDRFIIFSDHHKGVRDGADDFMRCEKAYSAALGYYLESGHTLLILGDAEELWECKPKAAVKTYRDILLLEAEFHKKNRYFKLLGNHDDYWEKPSGIRKLLEPIFNSPIRINESLRLLFDQGKKPSAEIFLVHGHQGDFLSDHNKKISKFLVRHLWRRFQRLTKIKLTTPAKDYKLRGKHSKAMYTWAEKKKNMVLIAGHTHLPVFDLTKYIEEIENKLKKARAKKNAGQVAKLRSEIELMKAYERKQKGREFSMLKPCYFNTGCCSFSDGDITGIEIINGQIRLVRWPDDTGEPIPKILAQTDLKYVFSGLNS